MRGVWRRLGLAVLLRAFWAVFALAFRVCVAVSFLRSFQLPRLRGLEWRVDYVLDSSAGQVGAACPFPQPLKLSHRATTTARLLDCPARDPVQAPVPYACATEPKPDSAA